MKKTISTITVILCSLLFLTSISFATAVNPFADFFNLKPNKPQTNTSTEIVLADTEKNPFLQEFLRVYEGDWIYVSNVTGDYSSVDVFKEPCVCNDDETECCGRFEVSSLDGNSTKVLLEGLFCLNSTYEIHIKDLDRTWDIQCIGVRGSRMESFLRIPGYAIDDPTVVECQTFRLVRPE